MSETYYFQCQRCFIVSGRMSRDSQDAPRCCDGEPMAALRVNPDTTAETISEDESEEVGR